jgi:hypothetical protein
MLMPCEITKASGSDRLLRVSKRKAGRDVAIIREILEGNIAMLMHSLSIENSPKHLRFSSVIYQGVLAMQ